MREAVVKISGSRWLLSTPVCALLAGCATSVVITPQPTEKSPASCHIHGTVRYDGKPEYLPRALIADPAGLDPVSFRYTFEAQYGLKETNWVLTAVNPLTLVGFPTGSDSLVITGHVEVVRGDDTIRSYAAAAAMKRSSTVFYEGETFTEMRHRGLLLVRDNLSGQLCHDEALLVAMLKSVPSGSTSDHRAQ
jgi:hypothetical protein